LKNPRKAIQPRKKLKQQKIHLIGTITSFLVGWRINQKAEFTAEYAFFITFATHGKWDTLPIRLSVACNSTTTN
jgi:hypothetical protein